MQAPSPFFERRSRSALRRLASFRYLDHWGGEIDDVDDKAVSRTWVAVYKSGSKEDLAKVAKKRLFRILARQINSDLINANAIRRWA
jgi:hypothetical protein